MFILLREFVDYQLTRERQVDAPKTSCSIGRGAACSYQIFADIALVSRVQAVLQRQGDGLYLHDGDPAGISSANGVWYNGNRLEEPLRLEEGMSIDLFNKDSYRAELRVVLETDVSHTEDTCTDEVDLASAFAALRRDMAEISAEMASLTAAIAATRDNDTQQSQQLARHDKLIRKIGVGMAACLVGLCVWNLSNGNQDAVKQAVSFFLAFVGGTGGAYLLKEQSHHPA